MRSGNPFGDHGQRAIMLSLIFKPVIANENGVGMPAPLTDQSRADFRDERGIEGPAFLGKFSGQGPKAAPRRKSRLSARVCEPPGKNGKRAGGVAGFARQNIDIPNRLRRVQSMPGGAALGRLM